MYKRPTAVIPTKHPASELVDPLLVRSRSPTLKIAIAVAVGMAGGAISAFRYENVFGLGGLLSLATGAGCGLASGILLVLLDRSRAKLEAKRWYGEPASAKRAAIVKMYTLYTIAAVFLIFVVLTLMAIFID